MPPVNTATPTPPAAPVTKRQDAKPGDVFYKLIDGVRGDIRYGHVAINGKWLSINLNTGALSSSVRGEGPIEVVGTLSYELHINAGQNDEMSRSELSDDAIFHAKGFKKNYMSLGTYNDGVDKFLSLDAGKPLSDDFSTTQNGTGRVVQVGTFSINARMAR